MWNRLPAVLAMLTATLITSSLEWKRPTMDSRSDVAPCPSLAPEGSPIDALDRSLQDRFHDIDLSNFGMARIPTVHKHVWWFDPETPAEKKAVAELKEAGQDVVFFLGGRGLLKPGMTEAELNVGYPPGHTISSTIFVTSGDPSIDVPRPEELWKHGRMALSASSGADSDVYKDSLGRWTIEARPVRADRQACLNCHGSAASIEYPWRAGDNTSPLRIGDPIGVVIFLYAHAPGVR